MMNLYRRETALCDLLIHRLSAMPEVTVYRSPRAAYVPIVSFSIRGLPSEEVAARLAGEGFCLRAGLHCAPLAHHTLGTADGTVRFAPSAFSKPQDVLRLAAEIEKICKKL